MKYEDAVIEDVRSRCDIVEVISGFIPLKRSGKTFKALCPFHQEKTPSFIVNLERQIFHCFGCSQGGDVFAFLMKYENITFPEALQQMAERVHVKLPEKARMQGDSSAAGKLYEVMEVAAQLYRRNLEEPMAGKPAREYLEKRGFRSEDVADCGLGFSLGEWRSLTDHLLKLGFGEDAVLGSGLAVKSAQGNVYDLFRGRLMFPIRNVRGKVVAFGGRALGEESPKYINSPETDIFRKRKEFYGLHLAKRFVTAEDPRLFIVEGYLDQIRLYAAGLRNAVATLGTALTEDHVRILKRFVTEAVLVYDGDKAGEMAALRGLELFLKEGLAVKLIALPRGFDPDLLIREKGSEAFRELAREAKDIFDFKLEALLRRYNKEDAAGLLRIVGEFAETLAHVPNAVLLDRYVRKLASTLGVEAESIRMELAKRPKKEERSVEQDTPRPVDSWKERGEVTLLVLAASDERMLEEISGELAPEEFQDSLARDLYKHLLRLLSEGKPLGLASLLNCVRGEPYQAALSRIALADWDEESRSRAVRDCVREIKRKNIRRRLGEIAGALRRAEADGHQEKVLQYMQEYQSLLDMMKGLRAVRGALL
jgi:DNA primase